MLLGLHCGRPALLHFLALGAAASAGGGGGGAAASGQAAGAKPKTNRPAVASAYN